MNGGECRKCYLVYEAGQVVIVDVAAELNPKLELGGSG